MSAHVSACHRDLILLLFEFDGVQLVTVWIHIDRAGVVRLPDAGGPLAHHGHEQHEETDEGHGAAHDDHDEGPLHVPVVVGHVHAIDDHTDDPSYHW